MSNFSRCLVCRRLFSKKNRIRHYRIHAKEGKVIERSTWTVITAWRRNKHGDPVSYTQLKRFVTFAASDEGAR